MFIINILIITDEEKSLNIYIKHAQSDTFPKAFSADVLGKGPLKTSHIRQPKPHISEDLTIIKYWKHFIKHLTQTQIRFPLTF